MASIKTDFEYDIFISYRHNDNRSGWVTAFVDHLKEELAATIKEPVSVYFDSNPRDGLLETHDVDGSLKEKLKCLILVPIISQTYCDPKSFAWKNEFLEFKKLAEADKLGLKVKLQNGNVASRILPVRIHELDERDKFFIEKEIGSLRAIDFIYKSTGVNRPLRHNEEDPKSNLAKTSYRDQTNKVSNAIKEIIYALQDDSTAATTTHTPTNKRKTGWQSFIAGGFALLLITTLFLFYFNNRASKIDEVEIAKALDRADQYLDEAARFHDDRYLLNAADAARKALAMDSTNERAMYLLAIALEKKDTVEYFSKKIAARNNNSFYALMLQAVSFLENRQLIKALETLREAEKIKPNDKDLLRMMGYINLTLAKYPSAWQYANRFQEVSGKGLHNLLASLYLEFGDFRAARLQLERKQKEEEFSCDDIETYQRILLCEGSFEKLERTTDSICKVVKCNECPYWRLRAKMHVSKFKEASAFVSAALKDNKLKWPYIAFVLAKTGKVDSAKLVSDAELKVAMERVADTTYNTIYLYSLAAIHAMRGNYKESIKWLRLFSDRGFGLGSEWYVLHDPLFDEMQKNNEYFGDMMQMVQKAQASKLVVREKIRELENKSKK